VAACRHSGGAFISMREHSSSEPGLAGLTPQADKTARHTRRSLNRADVIILGSEIELVSTAIVIRSV
jgi:hypothetical protein